MSLPIHSSAQSSNSSLSQFASPAPPDILQITPTAPVLVVASRASSPPANDSLGIKRSRPDGNGAVFDLLSSEPETRTRRRTAPEASVEHLWDSIHHGDVHAVEQLLSQRPLPFDVNAKNGHGNTALMLACARGSLEIIWQLVAHGADLQFQNNETKADLLMTAAGNGHAHVVEWLLSLKQPSFDVNAKNDKGATALGLACLHGHLNIARLLVDRGADLTWRQSGTQYNLLMVAAAKGHAHVVEWLLSLRQPAFDLNAENHKGGNALTIACAHGQLNVVRLLVDRGADLNWRHPVKHFTLLEVAIAKGKTQVAEWLLDRQPALFDVNEKSSSGDPLFMMACASGNLEMSQLLARKGADLSTRSRFGHTSLMTAAHSGNPALVEWLCRQPVSIDAVDGSGWTAFDHAVRSRRYGAIEVLLRHGCQLSRVPGTGQAVVTVVDPVTADLMTNARRLNTAQVSNVAESELMAGFVLEAHVPELCKALVEGKAVAYLSSLGCPHVVINALSPYLADYAKLRSAVAGNQSSNTVVELDHAMVSNILAGLPDLGMAASFSGKNLSVTTEVAMNRMATMWLNNLRDAGRQMKDNLAVKTRTMLPQLLLSGIDSTRNVRPEILQKELEKHLGLFPANAERIAAAVQRSVAQLKWPETGQRDLIGQQLLALLRSEIQKESIRQMLIQTSLTPVRDISRPAAPAERKLPRDPVSDLIDAQWTDFCARGLDITDPLAASRDNGNSSSGSSSGSFSGRRS